MSFVHDVYLFAPCTLSCNVVDIFMGLCAIVGMLGINLCFHRNLSHISFEVPYWLEYAFGYCIFQTVHVIGDAILFSVI